MIPFFLALVFSSMLTQKLRVYNVFKHATHPTATHSGNVQQCFGNVVMGKFCGFDIAEGHTTTA